MTDLEKITEERDRFAADVENLQKILNTKCILIDELYLRISVLQEKIKDLEKTNVKL